MVKFFRVFDLITFGVAFVVYMFADKSKIYTPLTLLSGWGIGRALYYVLSGTLQGTYVDGMNKDAEMKHHLTKSAMSLVAALEAQIKVLEERLQNKTEQTNGEETPSKSVSLRRFMKNQIDKDR